MALTKLLPNFLKLTAGGFGIFGVTMLPNYINVQTQDHPQSLQIVDTKNAGSLFMNNIKPKLIMELLKMYKWQTGLAISGLGSLFFIKTIGFDSLMYASRRQLSNGISNLTNSLTFIIDNMNEFKKNVYNKFDSLSKKMDINHNNVNLVIKQKSDELKCEMKDIKGNQNKTNGMLNLMTDKINIIEDQGKFISKGVYLLCNTVLNDPQNINNDHLEQLKVYNQFDNINKRTTINAP
tara:strand:- start:328 stop:1035 length:708 start_codon:yes stop_codon:yes gene_type:complete